MAEAQVGNKEQESIDLQLKSLVSQINTSTDDFDMDVAEAPTLPIPTAGKSMSSSDVAVSSLLSFSQGPSSGQDVGTNPFCNDAGSVSQFGILPSRPLMPQSNGLAASHEAQQNVGHPNGFPRSDSQKGADQSIDQTANSFVMKSESALPVFPAEDGDKIQIKKESSETSQVGLKPMEESEIERRNIAVAGFAALNGQDPIVRKSIRQPKKKMIQDYVEFSNSLATEEVEENKTEVKEELIEEIVDEPVKKKGKRGRKPKSGKGKKAAKEKLDVDEVYRSDDEEGKEVAEGEGGEEEDLNRDLMKVRMMKCNKCDKHFLDRSKLRMHQRAAHKSNRVLNEDTDYHCSECGKIFKRREHWRRHKEVHEVSRPHICITCGKAFKRLEHLKRHQSVHFTDKPFPCDECGKAFTRRDHLAKHKLLHESGGLIKPFAHKKSRKRKRIEDEDKESTEVTNVKGSRKRKITVQLKARKVETLVREEDYLDDKEAQSSDFLSSDDEPLASPKKKAKSSRGNTKKVQADIHMENTESPENVGSQENVMKSESEKSGNDVKQEREIQDVSENVTQNVSETVSTEYTQGNVALSTENVVENVIADNETVTVTLNTENEVESDTINTKNDQENLTTEDDQQSMNIVQEQQIVVQEQQIVVQEQHMLNENDDSANVTTGSSIQNVNLQDNLPVPCTSVISDQGNVISDNGLEHVNLGNVNVGQNVIAQETGQVIDTQEYIPNDIVAIDISLSFKE